MKYHKRNESSDTHGTPSQDNSPTRWGHGKKRLLSQKPLRETGGDTLLELIAVREA